MKSLRHFSSPRQRVSIGALSLLLSPALSGCIVIGGHTGHGGFFFIPGGIGGLVVILLLVALLRRR